MIRAIIIDDEPLARSLITEYLADHNDIGVLQQCNDGFEGVKAIMQLQPDLIFLDVQMPKINGFEMLELVENRPHVIFTTAFDEFAIRAFENHAVDYLLKPFSKERFDRAINQFKNISGQSELSQNTKSANSDASVVTATNPDASMAANSNSNMPNSRQSNIHSANTDALLASAASLPQQSSRIVVKTNGRIKIIPAGTIHYLEAADDYVKIITAEGSFLKNNTMAHFEKVLNQDEFVRIHRSYLVAVDQITRLEPYDKEGYLAILRSGTSLQVSRAGYVKLRKILSI